MISVMLMLGVLAMTGCNTTSSDRVEMYKQAVSAALEQKATIDEAITTLEQKIAEIQVVLQDPALDNDLREEVTAALTKAQGVLTTLNENKDEIAVKLKAWQATLESIDAENATFWDEIQVWSTGLSTAGDTVPSPWGAYLKLIGLVLGGAGAVGAGIKHGKAASAGLITVSQQQTIEAQEEASDLKTVLKQVVSSVDTALASVDATTATGLKTVLKTGQDDLTRSVVRSAQNNAL